MILDERLFEDSKPRKEYNSKSRRLKNKLTFDKVCDDLLAGVGENKTRYTVKGNSDDKYNLKIKNTVSNKIDPKTHKSKSAEDFIFDSKILDDAKQYFEEKGLETKEIYSGAEKAYSLLIAMPEEMFGESYNGNLRSTPKKTVRKYINSLVRKYDDMFKQSADKRVKEDLTQDMLQDLKDADKQYDLDKEADRQAKVELAKQGIIKESVSKTQLQELANKYGLKVTIFDDEGKQFFLEGDPSKRDVFYKEYVDLFKENEKLEEDIEENAYRGNPGDLVKDKVTGDLWKIRKHYQIGNYGYVQIEKDGVIRKLRMFADKNSSQDINRYILISKNESLKEDIVKAIEPLDSEVARETDFVFASNDQEYGYKMLSRLKSDNDYILGALKDNSEDGKVSLESMNKFLWFHDIDKQIAFMKAIYERLDQKPEWISLEDIDRYKKELKDIVRKESIQEEFSYKDFLDKKAIKYKGYFIDPFTIEKLYIGDKEYPGYTKYTIRTKDNVFVADKIENNEPHLVEFETLEDAKDFIDDRESRIVSHITSESLKESKINILDSDGYGIRIPDLIGKKLRTPYGDVVTVSDIDYQLGIVIYYDADGKGRFIHVFDLPKYELVESLTEELSPDEEKDYGITTLINNLIKDELEAIDGYNSAIVTLASEGKEEFNDIIKDIISEENVHIGQLQTILAQINNDSAIDIEKGQLEGQTQLENDEEKIKRIKDVELEDSALQG